MQIELYSCDLCRQEHRPRHGWRDNANGGAVTVCRDGINGKKKWEHLCPTCREAICTAVDRAVEERKTNPRGVRGEDERRSVLSLVP